MKFSYLAMSSEGRQERGLIDAPSKPDALRRLVSDGKMVVDLHEAKTSELNKRFRLRPGKLFEAGRHDAARIFGDLAMLTDAGLTISQALYSLQSSSRNPADDAAVEKIIAEMAAGRTAAQAFSTMDGAPVFALAMISSGENANSLSRAFASIAAHMQNREQTRATIVNALAYPGFLLVLMAAALGVVTFLLVPSLEPVFINSGKAMPAVIEAFVWVRVFLIHAGPVLFMFAAALALALMSSSIRKLVSNRIETIAVRLPVVGTLICSNGLSRYLSSLAMLVENGARMAQALSIAADSAAVPTITKGLARVCDEVSAGKRLPQALHDTGLFDSRTLSLIAVGYDAGKLPQVAAKAANLIDIASRERLNRLISILTPALTIVMGLLIGGLVVSVMKALLAVNELAIQ